MSTPTVFHVQSQGSTLIVVPLTNVGSLAWEDVDSELDDLLQQLDQPQIKNVVFDFEKVSYFGSSMLGAMHAMWKRVDAGNGKMAVCNVSDVEREVLEVSKFDSLWPVCDSRKEALEVVTKPDD